MLAKGRTRKPCGQTRKTKMYHAFCALTPSIMQAKHTAHDLFPSFHVSGCCVDQNASPPQIAVICLTVLQCCSSCQQAVGRPLLSSRHASASPPYSYRDRHASQLTHCRSPVRVSTRPFPLVPSLRCHVCGDRSWRRGRGPLETI